MRSAALFVLSLVLGSSAQQFPQHGRPQVTAEDALDETIVSALSQSTTHTTLLHLLQRAKCIPMLAHMSNATLFAPTDQAWIDWADANRPQSEEQPRAYGWLGTGGLDEWLTEDVTSETDELDNQNWALRQHLLYHLLNYTLPIDAVRASNSSNITIETTLLYPIARQPPLPPVPEPGPPWLPRGGEGLLGGHGQRLRIAKAGSDEGSERGKVAIDWRGEGGVTVWDGSGWPEKNATALKGGKGKDGGDKDDPPAAEEVTGMKWTRNGLLVGLDGVLDMPPSISEIVSKHPELSYLSRILPDELPGPLPESFATSPHLTVFAPSNRAFQSALDELEKGYLESDFGGEGVGRIFAGGVVLDLKHDSVGWSDVWPEEGKTITSASQLELLVQPASSGSLTVNGTAADAIDIFASNGVVHIVPTLLLPSNFTLLNSAEKVLLSLNATRFVSLLRSANLSAAYVGEPGKDTKVEQAWTFLAPTDEVLEFNDKWGQPGVFSPLTSLSRCPYAQRPTLDPESQDLLDPLPHPPTCDPIEDVSPLAALLQYHILPGRLLVDDIKDGMLVGTELRTKALSGGRQRLQIDVSETIGGVGRDWQDVEGEIRFGGAAVVGKPVKSGKSVIYLINKVIMPPDDVLQTAVSDLQLSTFIAAVYAADLDQFVKHSPGTTFFIPRNRAFNSLGLAMNYLLLPEGKDELRKVLKYHAIQQVLYTGDSETGRQVYKTLEGAEIVLRKTKGKNSTIYLQSPSKWEGHDSGDALPANGEIRPASVIEGDSLTSTGVIHTIDEVVMPADVDLTIGKLVMGSKQSTMADLLARAGLTWVLEGRQPTAEEIMLAGLEGAVRPVGAQSNDGDGPTDAPDVDSLAMPSYTLLCPTDKAWARLNITYYLQPDHREELLKLLQLHIIPTQPLTPMSGSSKAVSPPSDGRPLSMDDDVVYSTLLASSSKFGDVVFRATGDNSFLVGVRNARSSENKGDTSARIGASGRASVRWRKSYKQQVHWLYATKKDQSGKGHKEDERGDELWRGGMTLGGGVIMLDSVLVPYEPHWFSRWGWLVLTLAGIGVLLLITAGSVGWWWYTKGKHEYEPLEGEEEE